MHNQKKTWNGTSKPHIPLLPVMLLQYSYLNFKIYEKNKYRNKLNIIDVTLRDGAHQVDFNWETKYAKNHINTIIKSKDINFIELGYWKQTSKSKNRIGIWHLAASSSVS